MVTMQVDHKVPTIVEGGAEVLGNAGSLAIARPAEDFPLMQRESAFLCLAMNSAEGACSWMMFPLSVE